jgi:hypothetical protein
MAPPTPRNCERRCPSWPAATTTHRGSGGAVKHLWRQGFSLFFRCAVTLSAGPTREHGHYRGLGGCRWPTGCRRRRTPRRMRWRAPNSSAPGCARSGRPPSRTSRGGSATR